MVDLVIKNAMVVDGTGAKPIHADVAVEGGRIAAVEPHFPGEAARVIDAARQFLTPGFIDVHRHSDAFVFRPGFGEIQLRQGITATVNGNCGLSIAPCPPAHRAEILGYLRPIVGRLPQGVAFDSLSDYLARVEQESLPLHFGMHLGDGTLRMAVKGFESGPLTGEELAAAHRYLRDALDAGAFGVSMGLVYAPENLYTREEILQVLQPMRGSGIPLVTHIRGEGDLLVESLQEVADIARALEVPLHVSHFKCVGSKNWGHLLARAIALLDAEREKGLPVTVDVYPWTAGSSQLIQVLPPEYLEGGIPKALERLHDPVLRARCRETLLQPQTAFENQLYLVGWENIMVSTAQTPKNQPFVGMRITEIAETLGKDPYDTAFDLLVEEEGDVAMVNFIASEADIETILRYPHSYIVSDSIYPEGGKPHPRQYGTHPKLLAEYVREKKVLTLEQAVHKMTGAPAQDMRIANKGRVAPGFDADLVVFDLAQVENHADYKNPTALATGFSYVFVGGQLANDHDHFINRGAGRVLRRGRG